MEVRRIEDGEVGIGRIHPVMMIDFDFGAP